MASARQLYFEQLPTSVLLGRAVTEAARDRFGEHTSSEHQYEVAASYIYGTLGRYANEAPKTIQRYLLYLQTMGVITGDAKSWGQGGADEYEKAFGLFEVTVHQYLTCWTMVDRATKQLKKLFNALRIDIPVLHDAEIKRLFRSHKEIRDVFEHQDERFPVTKIRHDVPLIMNTESPGVILVGLDYRDGQVSIEGWSVDYTASGALKLQETVQRIQQSIRKVCVDIMVNHTTEDGLPFVRTNPPWGVDNNEDWGASPLIPPRHDLQLAVACMKVLQDWSRSMALKEHVDYISAGDT